MPLTDGFKRFFRRSQGDVERDVDDELQFHLDMKARDLEAGALGGGDLEDKGLESEALSPAGAQAEALSRFGDLEEIRGQCLTIQSSVSRRRARGGALDGFLQNLGVAVRTLRRRPGMTAAAVLTLALGIGATAAMFGVVSKVVLAPLPFQTPDRVVQLWDRQISLDNFRDYESRNDVFSHVAALRPVDLYVEREGRVRFMLGHHLSADLFDMMGVVPDAGRTFRADEDQEGVASVVLLTQAYWLREFGGEDVIGQTIPLKRLIWPERVWVETLYEIVGVLPADFRVPPLAMGTGYGWDGEPEVILPLGLWTWGRGERGMYSIRMLAQLRDGVTLEQAQANIQAIAAGIGESTPETETGIEASVVPVGELLRQRYGVALGFLWAATALVLLVACASVSSLLLGWGVAREQELAVRAALGAGARRIFNQLLTEGMVLAGAAGAVGVLLAYWAIGALKILSPAGVHRLDEVSLDLGVLGFTLGVSLVTVLLVSLWPAVRGARGHSSEVLKAGGRGATLARTRSLRVLVTAEVALSLVLLAGAGLMLQSFWNLTRVDTGIGAEWVLNVGIRLPPRQLSKYNGEGGHAELDRLMRERVEAIPGVTAFTRSEFVPVSGRSGGGHAITVADRPQPPIGERLGVQGRGVSPGFFRTLGIQFVEGRGFDVARWEARLARPQRARRNPPSNTPESPRDFSWQLVPREVVVSVAMARAIWPGESPLGKIFYWGHQDPEVVARTLGRVGRSEEWDPLYPPPFPREVVGVVQDVRGFLGSEPTPSYYHLDAGGTDLFVRTSVDPAGLMDVVRREIEAVDPSEIEVTRIRTVEQLVAEASADSRFRALMVGLFAVMATGLTCLGLFGVLTYAVTQRTREFGVRIALGAGHSDVAGLVLRQGARMTGWGVGLGLVLVFWLTRYISSLLFGVVPLDPTTLVDVAALIFALALVARYLPARRAMRVDPIMALRYE